MTYYLLCENVDGRWVQQFGDRAKAVVEYERDDYRDHGTKAKDLKILPLQDANRLTGISAVANLNGE